MKNNRTKKTDQFTPFVLLEKLSHLSAVQSIRDGLVLLIPILTLGAFALIFECFPIDAWKQFLDGPGLFLKNIAEAINKATFGVLSVHITFSISLAYFRRKEKKAVEAAGGILTALTGFFILVGTFSPSFSLDAIGVKAMTSALIASLMLSFGYRVLYEAIENRRRRYVYSAGADALFNKSLSAFLPFCILVIATALINESLLQITGQETFHDIIVTCFNSLFSVGEVGFFKGLFFVLFSSLLWFFGIHGSDVLQSVSDTYFAWGSASSSFLTKPFFDVFVLMGGCGTTIALLLAILFFSRNKSSRRLATAAAFPMLFNINELMVFGLPIIYNPVMFVPFILTPVLCYSVAYLATATGLVPVITTEVEWTTPVFFSGYKATGSVAGILLQVVLIAIGVAVYTVFLRMMDRQKAENAQQSYNKFVDDFRVFEEQPGDFSLIHAEGAFGEIAKTLAEDFQLALKKKDFVMYYQPQYRHDGECIGVESLLRWKHPIYGLIYPPLVMKLANECGLLEELEETIFLKVLDDRPCVLDKFGQNIKLSVNVTGTTISQDRFYNFLLEKNKETPFRDLKLCLEITEQTATTFNETTKKQFAALRALGLTFAIDDFSMGQTSIEYLKDNIFNIIKLDGSLVRGMADNDRCRDIISSIVSLAESLDITVYAEYVETERQKEDLHAIGCDIYQGYLYSPAVPVR